MLEHAPTLATATVLLHERVVLSDRACAEIRLLGVPEPDEGSAHWFKYSLAFVVDRACVLCYDNERGKGDHRHFPDGTEKDILFVGIDALLDDFWTDVDAWILTDGR